MHLGGAWYDMAASAKITKEIHDKCNNVFTELWYFEDMFRLQVKEGTKPYWALQRHVAYALQEPFKRSWTTLTEPVMTYFKN